jgi:uncharacterized membrane protein
MDTSTIATFVLIILVLGLGYIVNQHSMRRAPIHGGPLSAFFNFLSGLFFVAIMPTVCMSVLFIHPEMVNVAGITFSPVVLTVIIFAILSIVASVLFAVVEKTPLESALAEKAKREAQGWTEEDAKTSGL